MAYIPEDAKWFLADLVEEIKVEGCKRNIVHINCVLIQAASPEEAYRKAVELGKRGDTQYKDPAGQNVTIRFRGLREMDVICEPLEHGCEIICTERLGVTKAGLSKLVRKKEALEAFLPIRSRKGRPDYSSKVVMDEAARMMGGEKAEGAKRRTGRSRPI